MDTYNSIFLQYSTSNIVFKIKISKKFNITSKIQVLPFVTLKKVTFEIQLLMKFVFNSN